ncbi:MAG TPA: heme lyase CcmF/NrfE family subunit [Candidatus Dormibacteraeota bacterium]|nr:heme lyase CcmF/NrfE family subunit [Candidatus Dormibacteraeota bacterium]
MDIFGSFALILALITAGYAFIAGIVGIKTRNPLAIKSARRASLVMLPLLTLTAGCLIYGFFTNNFSMAYVAEHSSVHLPLLYKFAALWSGQEGSLLFWSWLLSMWTFAVLFTNRRKHPELMPYVGVVMAGVEFFFLLLNNFAANPFSILGVTSATGAVTIVSQSNGHGLNPLLQYPEMVIHPPMLYLGYTGMTVPFAFAMGALLAHYPGEKWIHLTRRWMMAAWLFLTCGILLGMHWAYAVLGWGGYWAWDPVENASLMPWLTGTAFLHSVMMQEKRGMMRVWNIWLVFAGFLLSILGTFLTRSGVVSSVHAFAQSSIGGWFLGFLAILITFCIWAYWQNRDYLKSDNQLDSVVSRESSFLFNNLVLLAAAFAVLWGTLFPVLSEAVQGSKISVGPPFFNRVNVPIALFLLFLTGVGPLLAWRKTSMESLRRNFAWPMMGGLVAGGVAFAYGFREFYALVCLILAVFVALTVGSEFFRGARVIQTHSGLNFFQSVGRLTMRNTRRYGGYIVHLGIVLIFVGIAGQAFNVKRRVDLAPGSQMTIGPYTLYCQNFDQQNGPNYTAEEATLEVFQNGRPTMMLFPERRYFPASGVIETMVSIHSSLARDLYVVYSGPDPQNNKPVIHAYLNPLVKWIWLGGIVVLLGTLLALLPSSSGPSPGKPQPAGAGSAAEAVPDEDILERTR